MTVVAKGVDTVQMDIQKLTRTKGTTIMALVILTHTTGGDQQAEALQLMRTVVRLAL